MDGSGKGYTTMRMHLIDLTAHLKMVNIVNFMLCFTTIKNNLKKQKTTPPSQDLTKS